MTRPILLKSKSNDAPKHLSREMKAFYQETKKNYRLFDHHLELLTAVCELFDQATVARQQVKRDGHFVEDRYGKPRPHPGLQVVRESLLTASRILERMGLDIEPTATPDKPEEFP